MLRKTTALVVVGALVLLMHVALLAPTVDAAPQRTAAQSQRLRSFATYAERVGAALELFAGGSGSDAVEDDGLGALQKGRTDADAGAAPDHTPVADASPLAHVVQYLQYPHTAVQSAVATVTSRAAAARTFAAAVLGAPLTATDEARLARVTAKGDRAQQYGILSPPITSVTRETSASAAAVVPTAQERSPLRPDSVLETLARTAQEQATNTPLVDVDLKCIGGFNIFSSDSRISCRYTGRQYTVAQFVRLTSAQQQSCYGYFIRGWYDAACVCAPDFYQVRLNDSATECRSRPLDVEVKLEDNYLCHNDDDAALGLSGTTESEYCIDTPRNSVLQLLVTWNYSFLDDDAMAAAQVFASRKNVRELPVSTTAGVTWVVLQSPFPSGTYTELSTDASLFDFIAAGDGGATASSTSGFYLSTTTELTTAFAFTAVFSFATPYRTQEQMRRTPFTTAAALTQYLGSGTGSSTQAITLDLSTVPDDFIEGGQMYVETGLGGGTAMYTYRVARIHIAFTDIPEPSAKSHKYPKQFNPLYILLIAAIAAVVVGSGLAALWYYCMQDEDYDDRLVSDAQRKKTHQQRYAAPN